MKAENLIEHLRNLIEIYDKNCVDSVNEEIEMWRKAYLYSLYGKTSHEFTSYFLSIPCKSFMKKKPKEWLDEIEKL